MVKALYGEVWRSHKFESWRKRIGSNPSEDEVLEAERVVVVKKALDVKIEYQIEYKKLNAVDKRNIYIYIDLYKIDWIQVHGLINGKFFHSIILKNINRKV